MTSLFLPFRNLCAQACTVQLGGWPCEYGSPSRGCRRVQVNVSRVLHPRHVCIRLREPTLQTDRNQGKPPSDPDLPDATDEATPQRIACQILCTLHERKPHHRIHPALIEHNVPSHLAV